MGLRRVRQGVTWATGVEARRRPGQSGAQKSALTDFITQPIRAANGRLLRHEVGHQPCELCPHDVAGRGEAHEFFHAERRILAGLAHPNIAALIDGGTVRLPRIVGQGRALDMILTGRPVAADEAQRIGLADRVVAAGAALRGLAGSSTGGGGMKLFTRIYAIALLGLLGLLLDWEHKDFCQT